jgi:hypothetical protein
MSEGVHTLRIVSQQREWIVLSILWRWHGALIEERWLVGMN